MEGQERSSARLVGLSPRLELIVNRQTEAIINRLDAIGARLAAIERHLGIAEPAPPGESPPGDGPAGEAPPGEGPPGEGPAGEGPAQASPPAGA
jgi:hypothetical protein